MSIINAFNDLKRVPLPQKEGVGGQPYLDNLLALQIGHGSTSMKVNKNGLGLGGKSPEASPFYVDMNGNVVANSIDLGGQYVAAGGAAADINANSTLVSGGKLVSLSITSTQIANNSISTPKLQANSVEANNIATNAVTAGKVAANAISADTIQAGAVTASKISVSSLSAITGNLGTLTAGTINASLVTITNLSASAIVTGTLTIGGSGAPQAILLRRDNSGLSNGNTFLRWEGGSRIWADSSNQIGINSLGTMYIYVGSSQKLIIPNSGQTTMEGGANMKGNLNVSDGWVARFTGEVRLDTNYIRFSHSSDAKIFTLNDMGLTSYRSGDRAGLSWGNGADFKVDRTGKWFQINGNAKEAVVPTSDGYRALYCIEAPEVWFMDFCEKVDEKYKIDPLFLEVTVAPYRYVRTEEEGVYQVWGKRKGHDHRRFEKRTDEQFKKNEKFLTMREGL